MNRQTKSRDARDRIFSMLVPILLTVGTPLYGQPFVYQGSWNDQGSGPGQFLSPSSLANDGAHVYVADDNQRIQKFTPDGAFVLEWSLPSPASDLAVGFDGSAYVADFNNHRIRRFDAGGALLAEWGEAGTEPGQLMYPSHLAVDGAGHVYVTESFGNRVQKFDSDGKFLLAWGSDGSGPGQFQYPGALATGPGGQVYVCDQANRRVLEFTAQGAFVRAWGSPGTGAGQFSSIAGIGTDATGRIFVVDGGDAYRVQVFAPTGDYLAEFGANGTGLEVLLWPRDVTVLDTGVAYVTDFNRRVALFADAATAAPTMTWGRVKALYRR